MEEVKDNFYPISKSIIDSFRFYIMLGCVVAETHPELKDKNVRQFRKELLADNFNKENIDFYIHRASTSLPPDFNSIMGLENFHYKEKQYFWNK